LQRFMTDYQWDEPWRRQRHWELSAASLADPQGVWSLDASEFPKKGEHSVGVAPQSCGALSNAPETEPLGDLIRVSAARWPIERCFEEDKSELGLDHYEHRSWPAWHRHMRLVFLAQLFLVRLRLRYKKSPGADVAASAGLTGMEPPVSAPRVGLRVAVGALPPNAESPGLPFPSQTLAQGA